MTPPIDPQNRIARWMQIARAYDTGLYRHSLLVADLASVFSTHLGFSPADQLQLVQAALLHDIGKTQTPRELLQKPSALTPDEMFVVRLHPENGYLLLDAEGGHSPETLTVVRQHHERLDGSGYPDGLLAPAISESVRIVTLCDIYAAMTETRSYGSPFRCEEALELMAAKRTRIDLRLMSHFAAMMHSPLRASLSYRLTRRRRFYREGR